MHMCIFLICLVPLFDHINLLGFMAISLTFMVTEIHICLSQICRLYMSDSQVTQFAKNVPISTPLALSIILKF